MASSAWPKIELDGLIPITLRQNLKYPNSQRKFKYFFDDFWVQKALQTTASAGVMESKCLMIPWCFNA